MVHKLKIQCPKCKSTYELFLSNSAPTIIMTCQNCWTHLLYNSNGVFVIPEEHDYADYRQSKPNDVSYEDYLQGNRDINYEQHSTIITEDDITNLKIDLAMCKDSLDFINSM